MYYDSSPGNKIKLHHIVTYECIMTAVQGTRLHCTPLWHMYYTDMTMNPLLGDKRHLTSSTDNTDMTMNPLSDNKRHLTSSTDTIDMTINPLSDDKRHLTSSTGNTNTTRNPVSDDRTFDIIHWYYWYDNEPLSDDKRHLTSSTGNSNMTMNPLSDDKTLTLQQQQPLVEHANRIAFPYPQKHPLRTSTVLTVNLRTQMKLVLRSK